MNLRLRFEVLKRDDFTCQYCGAQAPDVVLEVDHVVPRSAGGKDWLNNLATACRDCNQGKRADPLEPLEEPSDGGDWEKWEARLHDVVWDWFRSALEHLASDWYAWTGDIASIPEQYAIGKLLIRNDSRRLRQAMRISAVRHGYEPAIIHPETFDEITSVTHGRVDLREVHQTLQRWRHEEAWRHGE